MSTATQLTVPNLCYSLDGAIAAIVVATAFAKRFERSAAAVAALWDIEGWERRAGLLGFRPAGSSFHQAQHSADSLL